MPSNGAMRRPNTNGARLSPHSIPGGERKKSRDVSPSWARCRKHAAQREDCPMETAEEGYRSLRVERAGAIAEVALIGPGKGNAMGPDLWRELPAVFAALDGDDAVRVVLLHGSGAHFSYGLDLPAMMGDPAFQLTGELLAAERTRLYDQVLRMQEAFTRVAECRKPIIAAI